MLKQKFQEFNRNSGICTYCVIVNIHKTPYVEYLRSTKVMKMRLSSCDLTDIDKMK
jgi:hypothetical protein